MLKTAMVEHIDTRINLTDEQKQEIAALEKTREAQITRIFWLALEIALVFLVPALLTVFVVGAIWSRSVVWYILPFSFVLSWGIVIIRYRGLSRKLEGLDKRIKELRNPNE